MKKAVILLFVLSFVIIIIGCQNNIKNVIKDTGEVGNRNDFLITTYDIKSIKVENSIQIAGDQMIRNKSLDSYEQSCLQSSSSFTGQAAIIEGRKIGKSESFYKDGGFFINDAGNKEQDITAFSLTQIEVIDTHDGVKIKADDTLIKKGDIITVLELIWIEKDKLGNDILRKPYLSNRVPIEEDTIYILYLSKFRDGAKHHSAILKNVWISGQDMFILNNETRKINSKEDVLKIKENGNSKYYMNEYLYPLVIEKYSK